MIHECKCETLLQRIEDNNKAKLVHDLTLGFLAFAIPFLMLCILFASNGFSPFVAQGKTIVSFDMQSEYVAYMRYFKAILQGDKSFIYTEGKVFGGDFFSIYSFYLASPLNFFVVFVDNASIPDFFLMTSIVKMCLASLFFFVLIRFKTGRFKIGNLVFCIGYGLISYSLMYISNYMWLDAVAFLPLVILGLELLKENKHHYVYPIAIALTLMSSWYTGFIVCLFAGTMIIYYVFTLPKEKNVKLKFFTRAAIFSLLGGFLASFAWLTAFFHFSGTKAFVEFPKFQFFSLSMLFSGFLENGYASSGNIRQYRGYISMFTGVVSLVFFLRYFMNTKYTKRERLSSLGLCIFYALVILNSFLTALFHGGKEPTWFPGRYSFVIGFLICYFAFLDYDQPEGDSVYSLIPLIAAPIIVLPVVLFTENSNYYEDTYEALHYQLSVPSLLIYIATTILVSLYPLLRDVPLMEKNTRIYKAIVGTILVPLGCLSSYRGYQKILSVNVADKQFQDISEYQEDDALSPLFDDLLQYDPKDDFRMEATFNRPGNYNQIDNNPMFYGYNGLSHFSSCEKKDVEDFFDILGFQYNGFFEKYDGGSTATINSLLNVKYLIADDAYTTNKPVFFQNTSEDNPWKEMTEITPQLAGYQYYENTNVLPYGFIINSDADESTPIGEYVTIPENGEKKAYYYDSFEFQNHYMKSLVGKELDDIFYPIPLTESFKDDVIFEKDFNGFYKVTCKKYSVLNFYFTIPEEYNNGNFYFDIDGGNKYMSVRLDGRSYENLSYWHEGIRGFIPRSGQTHHLQITMQQDCNQLSFRPSVCYEDLGTMNQYIDRLQENALTDVRRKNSFFSASVEGELNLSQDVENQTIFFTFPREDNVSIYVDGVKQEVVTRGNIFAAATFTQLSAGKHIVTFTYTDKGFVAGSILSVAAGITLIFVCAYYRRLEDFLFCK